MAAAILAVIVIFTFTVLYDYGPESAIRRFHYAVLHNDPAGVQSLVVQPVDPTSVEFLVNRVLRADANGASYTVARMARHPKEVLAVVVYTTPAGLRYPTVWDVVKDGPTWKIDARRTLTVFRDATGL